jgi:hypothetical protein
MMVCIDPSHQHAFQFQINKTRKHQEIRADKSATANIDDLDDPLHNNAHASSSREGLTGNITSSSYLTSRIPGEDRRAAANTIDESVWETLRRDLLAVWSKMREVLYPKYLFGGSMIAEAGSVRGAYTNLREAGLQGAREELVGFAGRALDADHLLASGGMSEGLRDWDLWGPLLFCLLLSMLLSIRAKEDQANLVFSGVFAMVWLGEVLVTLQIKLLGGNMYVSDLPLFSMKSC